MRVGFVGLGNMGWPMARNLVRAGHALTVRDADAARQERFATEHGCAFAADPAAFAEVEVVVTMLPTGAIVRDVLLGWDGGLARALRPGSVVVDMSSSEPMGTRALGAELLNREIALVDAPVSGGVPKAEAGTLSIMMGGDDEPVARVRPLLEALGERFFRTGLLGSGHAMKALNNYVSAAGHAAAVEALVVGGRFGLDPAVVVEVLNASTGRNFNTEYTFVHHTLPRRFTAGFALGLMAKDIGIAADLAAELGVDAPLSREVRRLFDEARDELGAGADISETVRHWESRNGYVLPVREPAG
jgi:3-hydroxyisobutyrate dehydrogenase